MFEEKVLIWKIKKGDAGALRFFCGKYGGKVFGASYLLVGDLKAAEEITYQVFCEWLRGLVFFDIFRDAQTLLMTSAASKAAGRLSAGRFEIEREVGESVEGELCLTVAGEDVERWERVVEALRGLPDHQRQAVVLHLMGEVSFRDISKIDNVSESAVEGRYRYGLEQIESELRARGGGVKYSEVENLVRGLDFERDVDFEDGLCDRLCGELGDYTNAFGAWMMVVVLGAAVFIVCASVLFFGYRLFTGFDGESLRDGAVVEAKVEAEGKAKELKERVKPVRKGFEQRRVERGQRRAEAVTERVEVAESEEVSVRQLLGEEMVRLKVMYDAGDVEGLLAEMKEGEAVSKFIAANHLWQIGGGEVLAGLREIVAGDYDESLKDLARATIVRIVKGEEGEQVETVTKESERLKSAEEEAVVEASEELCGYVFDEVNEGMVGAEVKVRMGGAEYAVVCDAEGWYEFGQVGAESAGDVVEMVVYADGYGDNEFAYNVEAEDNRLDVQMFVSAYERIGKRWGGLMVERWLNGAELTAEAMAGHAVVFCAGLGVEDMEIADTLDWVVDSYAGRGVVVVGVFSRGKASAAMGAIEEFVDSRQVRFWAAIDDAADAAREYVTAGGRKIEANRIQVPKKGLQKEGATYSLYEVKEKGLFFLVDREGVFRGSVKAEGLAAAIEGLLAE
jgi:RNA polymerase sigma-70 factor (ECF subfamily)